jgi:hypothetical protein
MPANVREITDPASDELGCRVFEVEISPGHRLQFIVTHEAREDCPGDIHAPEDESFLTIEKPVTDAQLYKAVDHLARALLTAPTHTTFLVTA